MTSLTPTPAQAMLAAALDAAAGGGLEEIRRFFNLLRSAMLFVPARSQAHQPDNSAAYPDEFLNVLALEDDGRVYVPCFIDAAAIHEWYPEPLTIREIEFSALSSLLPEDWWLVLNPASEACKELSPWELQRLRGDDAALLELLEELRQPEMRAAVTVEEVSADQAQTLRESLTKWATAQAEVAEVYLARENSVSLEPLTTQEDQISTLLIGIAISRASSEQLDRVRSAASAVAAAATIGDETPRVLCGAINSVALGVFKGIQPIYRAKRGIINYLFGQFKR